MRKPGRGALYYCSSEQGTPRGVERTTWLSRGFTGAIGTPFCHLKIRSALGVLILGAAAFYSLLVLEQHSNSTCAKNPDAKFDAEAPFQPCKDEHSKREARVSTDIKTNVTGLAIAPRHPPKGI